MLTYSDCQIPIKQTNYTIDLNGDIRHKTEGNILKSDFSQGGRRNTRIIYNVLKKRERRYSTVHKAYKTYYKVVSNARLMINSFFLIPFSFKIEYKDNDRTNTNIENLIIFDTMGYKTGNRSDRTYFDLSDYLDEIYERFENAGDGKYYQRILLTLT